MCLLISQQDNKPIEKESLENASFSNPDGMGFAYSEGGKIQIRKYRNFKKFYSGYKKAIKTYGKVSDFIIHFRYSTSGIEKGVFNVHPFRVSERLAFAHNGILSVENHNKKSDTQVFNETILKQLPAGFLRENALVDLIEGFIGTDKLVFLDNNGKSVIINESRGHWLGGAWYSNGTYKCAPAKSYGWEGDYYTQNYGYTTRQLVGKIYPTNDTRKRCSHCQQVKDVVSCIVGGVTQKLCNVCVRYSKA